MKKSVLVFINLRKAKEQYCDEDISRIVQRTFNDADYDIRIIDYPNCQNFYDLNEIWAEMRNPILIGYKEGANYIEGIKNYSRKYLICPIVYENGYGRPHIPDEYDQANTDCIFGSDKRSLLSAEIYTQYYQSVNYPGVEGDLSFEKGMESVRILDEVYRMPPLDNILKIEKIRRKIPNVNIKYLHMPKQKRHLPGNYKPKQQKAPIRNANGPAPLALFQGEDGLWGVRDANGNIELEPIYHRIENPPYQTASNVVILSNGSEVISVSPEDWDLLLFSS